MIGDTVYRYRDALYLNITNRCPTACVFCIKKPWDMGYRGYDLRLEVESPAREILDRIGDQAAGREVVFCGFGEPTYRLDAMADICAGLRRKGASLIRLNTVGLGSLIHGRDITPELARMLDAATVSLNTSDPAEWVRTHRPLPAFREQGFSAVLEFIRGCVRGGLQTVVTAVEVPGLAVEPFRALVAGLGAECRLRPVLEVTPKT
ncbi:MAG: hypothetical protein A2X36_10875 [Elusimicrobia bacterium GWA2_69_24]|nr:MAG: hypothetical protein A2X36_10875 [Elusimicrobia bacterium GWA2_69_24]HBL18364.1 radical SAM protein [Elusimicrobiota bacterium]